VPSRRWQRIRSGNGGIIDRRPTASRAERRPVRVGATEGDRVEIQSGLSTGDRIVVEGPDSLTDGTRVQEE
jgi:multidrug efflux pump subunit AcrA (membrane-fusion protein)